MYLLLTLTSLASLFIAIHAIPIKYDIGKTDVDRVHKTLNKRNDYSDQERDRDDRYYGDRYGGRGYNPDYIRDYYDYRRPIVAASNRMYVPQYYSPVNGAGNVYSDTDIQNYITAAAAAAAAAAASTTSNSAAAPASPVMAAQAPGTDTLAYQAMLASADPSTLFNSYQAATGNAQPASAMPFPGFTASPEAASNPFAAQIAPPRAQPAALTGPKPW